MYKRQGEECLECGLLRSTIDNIGSHSQSESEWEKEEWGGWKIVSDMLDNPDKNGIYPTSECYRKLYDFVVAQKEKAISQREQEIVEDVEKLMEPNLGGDSFEVEARILRNFGRKEALSILKH